MSDHTAESCRILWIDIARGICIISIVIGHVYHNSLLRTYTLSFDVPMFFFLSGLCYRKPKDSIEYFLNKAKRVVIPYFSFSIISILIFAIAARILPQINNIMNCSLRDNILIMFWGNSKPDVMKYNSPLWFLTCYFSVLLLAFVAEKIIDRRYAVIHYSREIIIICLVLIGWAGAWLGLMVGHGNGVMDGGGIMERQLYCRGIWKPLFPCLSGLR